MNRVLVFGIAIFFAIVGVALVGGENQAVAGHGCHGCSCDCDGDDSCGGDECCGGDESCDGDESCGGKRSCRGRRSCKGRKRCHKACCDAAEGGEEAASEEAGAEAPPEAPAAEASFQRVPLTLRRVNFRR